LLPHSLGQSSVRELTRREPRDRSISGVGKQATPGMCTACGEFGLVREGEIHGSRFGYRKVFFSARFVTC
jgi:hypothetical protein